MHYNIIFDVAQTGFRHWSYLVYTVILISLALLLFRSKKQRVQRLLSVLFLFVFSTITACLFIKSYRNYLELKWALLQSRCQVAEGVVANYHTDGGYGDTPKMEMFSVNGVEFVCAPSSMQNGFNQPGIIRDKSCVRIHYGYIGRDAEIARMEVAQ